MLQCRNMHHDCSLIAAITPYPTIPSLLFMMEFLAQNLDRVWKNKRTQCEKFECGHLVVDENMNCVNNCTSALCFKVRDACVRCVVHSLTHLFPSFYHVLV
mmetsp:Transcript_16737/g.27981  ORF Transcript_16737/g.27981 Transcript_16737/m.27981 type:complete len:101 (-) Transcript_16737:776-1078(-)